MRSIPRLFLGLVALILILGGMYGVYTQYLWWRFDDYELVRVQLKKHVFAPVQREFTVEVVRGQAALTRGLSDRADLLSQKDDTHIDGLLFLFTNQQVRHFWMKDMRFAIDICWLDFPRVVSCVRDAPPPQGEEMPARFNSLMPVSAVLETRPGFLSEADLGLKLFFRWW